MNLNMILVVMLKIPIIFILILMNPDNNHCVEDNLWNTNKYTTEFLCTDNEISPNCCLKRERNPNHHCPNSDDIFELINFNRFKDFQTEFDISE